MTDYSEELPAPAWPNSHDIALKHHTEYPHASQDELAREHSAVRRHEPLVHRFRHERRAAGTNSEQPSHGDDREPDAARTQSLDERAAAWERIQQQIAQKGGMDAILKDPKTLVTVRDIMQMPDFKVLDPRHHAYARTVLPITEGQIKNQEWEGKDHSKDKMGDARNDIQRNKVETQGTEHSHAKDGHAYKGKLDRQSPGQKLPESEASPAERAFADAVIAETHVVLSMKNNLGKPHGPLQLLTRDAWRQLESRISVDDQATPDNWIPRSEKLLRLTGKHPLNAEPNMSDLYEAGMITPTKLHYVRNHGAVPVLDWNTHKLSVFGEPANLVPNAREFSMRELAEDGHFEVIELPVTLACDGNRRGEVNSIKKSGGFSWSAAGVSTCLWRGVLVCDVLRHCGFQDNHGSERLYLHYEGADQLSEGTYATSIPLKHAMDPQNDVLLAFGQNGRILHPDHGAPLRSIIPGFVGGRCVKWLRKLWVSDKPSVNHYHIWDNRVLPSWITSKDTLAAKALFHHPDTACNEQQLQSITCTPSHGEQIPIPAGEDALEKTYRVAGFAYHGGGHMVQRVELSIDGGKEWKYCFRNFVKNPLRHGSKHWAWVFWHCDVSYRELLNSQEIIVRAWDVFKNGQPEHVTFNLLGMMNNAWYRVKLSTTSSSTGLVLSAQHPIAPGAQKGGWMAPPPEEDRKRASQNEKTFTLDEVAKHNTQDDCWIILDDKVYDVTSVLSWHPGGAKAIMGYAGRGSVDASTQYASIHDNYANFKRDECLIGVLSESGAQAMREDAKRAARVLTELKQKRAGLTLMPDTFCRAVLKNRQDINADTRIYTFELPRTTDDKAGKLGLPIGKHVQVALHFKDQACVRSYTPIRPVLPDEEDGTVDLLVKTYPPSSDGPFPPGGTMSNFLDVLKEGGEVDMRGPTGEIEYLGGGTFNIERKEYQFQKINLVAGGSGLTPHYQIIHAILKRSDKDKTQISFIDSNKTVDDILMREQLEQYEREHPEQFKLWHTLSKAPDGWKFDNRHMDEDMLRRHLFPAEEGVGTFLCGPPGLIAKAAVPALKTMGFKDGETMFGF